MNEKKKIYLLFASAVFLLNILSGCTSQSTASSTQTTAVDNANQASSDQANVGSSASPAIATHLSIGSGCVGCGRCARIDSEHFSMDQGAHRATVVSQNNLDTTSVTQAVSACPARAIALD